MKGDTCGNYQKDQAVTVYGVPAKNNRNGKKSNTGQVRGALGKGKRAGRNGVPQFMIASCQSANERTLLVFIEITPAIDGRAGIEPLLIASLDLACPFIPSIYFLLATFVSSNYY